MSMWLGIQQPSIPEVPSKLPPQFVVDKVQLFWEGHKNVHNLPLGFDVYLGNVKTSGRLGKFIVAFSEKLNFMNFSFSIILIFDLWQRFDLIWHVYQKSLLNSKKVNWLFIFKLCIKCFALIKLAKNGPKFAKASWMFC